MKIKVFQVNSNLDSHGTKFRDYDSVLKTAGRIDPSVYNTTATLNARISRMFTVFSIRITRPLIRGIPCL